MDPQIRIPTKIVMDPEHWLEPNGQQLYEVAPAEFFRLSPFWEEEDLYTDTTFNRIHLGDSTDSAYLLPAQPNLPILSPHQDQDPNIVCP
jgi:hypothetical protein